MGNRGSQPEMSSRWSNKDKSLEPDGRAENLQPLEVYPNVPCPCEYAFLYYDFKLLQNIIQKYFTLFNIFLPVPNVLGQRKTL